MFTSASSCSSTELSIPVLRLGKLKSRDKLEMQTVVFFLAFAYSLCCGLDPHTIRFNQSSMRAHFDLCVDKEKIDTFPTSSCCRQQITKNRIKSVKVVHVFCTCRPPWDKADTERDPLVKC